MADHVLRIWLIDHVYNNYAVAELTLSPCPAQAYFDFTQPGFSLFFYIYLSLGIPFFGKVNPSRQPMAGFSNFVL